MTKEREKYLACYLVFHGLAESEWIARDILQEVQYDVNDYIAGESYFQKLSEIMENYGLEPEHAKFFLFD